MKGLFKGDHGAKPCPQRCYGRIGTRAAVLVLAMMVGLSGPAMAAIDVLTVTATKRAESLQSVGVSVNAFTGDAMEKLGIHNSDEVLLRVPNLEIQANNGSTNANIFIRGLGTTGPGFNTLSGVGIYSDEVSLNSPVVNILQVYDLERIEILRGPQNTLYGRNTTGGAVNFISRKPEIGGEANGYVRATYGRFNQADIEGAFGAPLGEKWLFGLLFKRSTGTVSVTTRFWGPRTLIGKNGQAGYNWRSSQPITLMRRSKSTVSGCGAVICAGRALVYVILIIRHSHVPCPSRWGAVAVTSMVLLTPITRVKISRISLIRQTTLMPSGHRCT